MNPIIKEKIQKDRIKKNNTGSLKLINFIFIITHKKIEKYIKLSIDTMRNVKFILSKKGLNK